MKKRMIALLLILAMLVSIAPAVVADDTVPRPTVEEILSEYHQKAFEAEAAGETATASTYSRSGSSGKTLEQETVDTLNAAGYEAYNVTAENFEALEAQLQTDFADMGLDPNGSYIIAISGEEPEDSTASGISPRAMVPYPIEGGGGFSYTYNGTTYTMRYVTVTCVENSNLDRMFAFSVNRNPNGEKWGYVFDAIISSAIDAKSPIPITTINALIAKVKEDNSFTAMDCNKFMLTGSTTWTLQYIQVYKSHTSEWVSSQCSEYAVTSAQSLIYVYNIATESHTPYAGELFSFKTYSNYYNDAASRKYSAALGYINGTCNNDYTGDITITVKNASTNSLYYICTDVNDEANVTYNFVRDHWTFYN